MVRSLLASVLSLTLIFAPVSARATTHEPTPGQERTSKVLGITGGLTFGLAYLPMLALGVASFVDGVAHFRLLCSEDPNGFFYSASGCPQNDGAALVLPVAGPFMFAAPRTRDDLLGAPNGTTRTLLAVDGVAQLTGAFTLVTLGVYRMAISQGMPAPPSDSRTVSVEPEVGPSRAGFVATLRF